MSAWRSPGHSPRTARIALYRVPLLDAFTKTPPWLPYLTAGPVAVACTASAMHVAMPAAIGAFALGGVSWTLVEYLMHRFLFHARVTSETGRIVTFLAHGHHHVYPDDPHRIAATPLQLVSLMLLFWGGFQLSLGALAPVAMAGALAFYLLYELAHWTAHHGRSQSALVLALRRHHLAHHHKDPHSRWGIGSPLWDVVFRTLGPATPKSGTDAGAASTEDESSGP